jgi:hypothetical protein
MDLDDREKCNGGTWLGIPDDADQCSDLMPIMVPG